jgi:D-alanine--poly(phosphoribitol) ligase subunit 1
VRAGLEVLGLGIDGPWPACGAAALGGSRVEIIERIDRWGRMTPDRAAHHSGGRTLTYGELRRRSDALAARLAGSLPEKSPVVVLGHKEPELLIAYLGVIKSGRAYVPVDTAVPPQRIGRIVAASGAPLTLTPEKVAELSDGGEPAPPWRLEPDDHYYIMFTSGSTGEPKGVPITYGCLQSFLRWILAEHAFEEGREVFLNVVPYSFDVSLMDTHPALVTGGTVTSVTKEEIANPRQLYPLLGRSALTTWVSTPSFAQMCLVEPTFNGGLLPRLRRFLFCGETLAPEIAAQLLDRFPAAEVWNTYGPTEATVATTSIRITRAILDRYSSLPIGYPMPGTRVLVMGERGREVPPGERGEIIIAGPNVSPGYLNRPDLVERVFFLLDGRRAYRTGDWGRYRDDMLFFEGRVDNQVKLHGHRIELADVEANLRALPGVRDAVVLPVLKQGAVDSLAAFVILNERPPRSDFQLASELKVQLIERLPAYMIPRKFSFLDSFLMNINGKADRGKLAEALK